jgi:hypothetical protein
MLRRVHAAIPGHNLEPTADIPVRQSACGSPGTRTRFQSTMAPALPSLLVAKAPEAHGAVPCGSVGRGSLRPDPDPAPPAAPGGSGVVGTPLLRRRLPSPVQGGQDLVGRALDAGARGLDRGQGLLHARAFVGVHQRPFTGFDPLPRTFGHLAFSEIAILGIGQREQAERWNHAGHGHQSISGGGRPAPPTRL